MKFKHKRKKSSLKNDYSKKNKSSEKKIKKKLPNNKI